MKTIRIIDQEEIEELFFYDDIFNEPLLTFAEECINLYKKRGDKWLSKEEDQIKKGMTSEQIDEEDSSFFDKYFPLRDKCILRQKDLIKKWLEKDRTEK